MAHREKTHRVRVGSREMGGGAPVLVQTMTNTATADVETTVAQALALWRAGAEAIRITVNTPEAAAAVPEIQSRLRDSGCEEPLIGDFHYNGHRLLADDPACAEALDKYRINPGNVGRGSRRDHNFATICRIAADHGKAVRIGVNVGSLDPELVTAMMEENARRRLGRTAREVLDECMILSALRSVEAAVEAGLGEDRIVISCKTSVPVDLIRVHRELARRTRQPIHLGLTEAGMGSKGMVWSAAAMAVLLEEGIGDTIRVSLTPRPGGDRAEEVRVAWEILQALGLRSHAPSVTACPGCGRTTSDTFQHLAQRVEAHLREQLPQWRKQYPGVEELKIAVMGCIVNGPGESRHADIGISLPGTGETPRCPVFIEGRQVTTLQGDSEELAAAFLELVEGYVASRFGREGT